MCSWKICAANLTFSSVVGFSIYCESEISAQHFPFPLVLQDHRLNKPIGVFRIFSEHTSWPAPEQLISHTGPCLVTYKVWWRETTNFYMYFALPKVLPMNRVLVLPQRSDGKTEYGAGCVDLRTCCPSTVENLCPEHSSQALLGSTAVKTQAN